MEGSLLKTRKTKKIEEKENKVQEQQQKRPPRAVGNGLPPLIELLIAWEVFKTLEVKEVNLMGTGTWGIRETVVVGLLLLWFGTDPGIIWGGGKGKGGDLGGGWVLLLVCP